MTYRIVENMDELRAKLPFQGCFDLSKVCCLNPLVVPEVITGHFGRKIDDLKSAFVQSVFSAVAHALGVDVLLVHDDVGLRNVFIRLVSHTVRFLGLIQIVPCEEVHV